MLELMDFYENPTLGVFCKTNDKITFIRRDLSKSMYKKIEEVLKSKIVKISIADANIVGSLISFNSYGAVVTDFVDIEAIKVIQNQGLKVCVISDKINATGNDILVNDKGALVHPDLDKKSIKDIENTLNVPVIKGTIALLKTVGMAAVVTNKGLLCHPKVTDEEKIILEKLFDVNVMIGTVNHGSPVIGSGLVANTKGALIGNATTGIELGRIEEALGFL